MSDFGISNFVTETAGNYFTDVQTNGYGLLLLAIEKVLDPDVSADLIECEEALLAAEFIAAAMGHAAHDFPEDASDWVLLNLPMGSVENQEIVTYAEKAADAIDIIVTESELRDLWEENPEFEKWFQAQVDLQKRLLD